jgi:hypothetical protein
MRNAIIGVIVIIIIGLGAYLFISHSKNANTNTPNDQLTSTSTDNMASSTDQTATTTANSNETKIATSVGGRDVTAYHFGTGSKQILFIGGIHGGYEWNTSLVAYDLMDYLQKNPSVIPANVEVTVIPVLNPDGLSKVVGTIAPFSASSITASQAVQISGRLNGNGVDLNRNFDCDWQAQGVWQSTPVSGGTAAFSEPESAGLKQYIESNPPTAVVVWYSAAGGVYASSCHSGVLPETQALTSIYATASGYPAHESFDFYATTGDLTNWLAKINIPAISILLTNHTDPEWSKNQAGVQAVLQHYVGK